MSRRRPSDSGSVTAEFAVVFPTVILTMGLMISGAQALLLQVEMQRLAAMAARELARGGSLGDLGQQRPNFNLVSFEEGNLQCVLVRNQFPEFEERACALKEGN